MPACEFFGALRFGDKTPGDTGADSTRVVRGGGNVDGGALGEGFFSLQTYFLFDEDSCYVLHEVFAVVFDDGGLVELLAAYALGPAEQVAPHVVGGGNAPVACHAEGFDGASGDFFGFGGDDCHDFSGSEHGGGVEFAFSSQVAEDAVFAAESSDGVDEPGGKRIGIDRHRHALEAAGTHEFAFHFLLQEFTLAGDAQHALSGIRGGHGIASAQQNLSGDLLHGFDALGDGGGAHSQDICRRVEGAIFDDGGEGGELVGTETCHKNILRSVKIFR